MNAQANIVELINITHEVSWLAWGVQYFFLIGLSIGAFLLTLPAFVLDQQHRLKAARLALVVAITCGIAAPIALLADLHQPGRFYNFYLHFTAGSWMSWGSFFLPAYVTLLLLYAWLIYRPGLAAQAASRTGMVARISRLLAFGGTSSATALRSVALLTLFAALAVLMYTGAEMAVVRARPLWHTPMMPLLFLTTALAGATGLSMLLNRLLANDDSTVNQQLGRLLNVFLIMTLVLLAVWFVTGISGLSVSGEVLQRLAIEYKPVSFLLVWVFICTAVPLQLLWMKSQSAWPAGALALLGAWWFRWIMFIDGQSIPKNGAGTYDYSIPLGSEGWLGIIGTLGLWLLLVMLIKAFLPWQGDNEQNA